jgi:hypothetical protein
MGEMGMKLNKASAVIVAAILTVVATLMFLVADVTGLYVTAYVFALLGIAILMAANLFLLDNAKFYPWNAAIPQGALLYLVTELVVSVVVIIFEQSEIAALPLLAFIVIHAAILAVFAIRLVMLNAGLEAIERTEGKVKAATDDWKTIIARLETLAFKLPELKPLLEEVKYSDPAPSLAAADCAERIEQQLTGLEQCASTGNKNKVSELSSSLSGLVKERNQKLKASK